MNDWFSFEQSPWDMAADKLRSGDTISAAKLLTLLEGEEEQAVETALETVCTGSWYLNSEQYERETGLVHREFVFQIEKR